ncbi:MAG: DUF1015 family protein [Planctomycetales bacterium]|nr:DUF1015 family protein [Planctomycetales bacterium]NIN09559.1 DUF1015 family protein [Planctomycetales bacterium]NIN78671.1 DUF1015 family protein [Planctomycetales bacterium]NIO35860.1 DUF1015 family protein [Planctomycetales bacterium]NIO47608.1 DUF1015 family protein [Planctomycetales bacterium]
MPVIEPFAGLRYDLGHVGSLSNVVAPPYDVIDARLQDELYKQHPANVIRLILNRSEPGDQTGDERYQRAARYLRQWLREGVLFREPDPAVYVYHQVFQDGDVSYTRRGFMARCRLQKFGEGNIYPHEETMAGPKADRLQLTRACQANLSQIFGIYPDAENEAQNLLEAAVAGDTPVEATDHLGVVHRVWPVTDIQVIHRLASAMAAKPMFIADGHHRYETACNYRDELENAGQLTPTHPAHGVLMMCVGMSDPGMIVLPTHRLFHGLPDLDNGELTRRLADCFHVEQVGHDLHLAEKVWQQIAARQDQGSLGLFTAKDQCWAIARLTQSGRQRMADVAAERSNVWQSLGVSILHRLLVDTLLDSAGHPKPTYVHQVCEVVATLSGENGQTDPAPAPAPAHSPPTCQLAALVLPATLQHIRQISEQGERMPAKSTYFYPKLLSGLVIHPLNTS